ncbi:MAG: ATP synthase F1 subunit gamma [Bacteroidales bacterium]|jgi:F-type H+-transporting ATPase subunit gamma|nr:ATP synthase F1 subunit gamma [Bacteroidales bacterium]MDI9576277.1 ATP synthase F1 subunit gamma [Bacteroidota bacterium]MDD2593789.1 ATP synthase F1 subunit gamma [Bacteroidales bacterium]MDD3756254.1 ATP synthase F1 subunit gamma [Bacteroidales bacterium]MDY0400608.1 ATP synthase F1 subunit gamma [Bacteroidales bacterium]
MATLKAIKTRIKSIESTQQITQAMKLVSAAKLRRTQDKIIHLRQYSKLLTEFFQLVYEEKGNSLTNFFDQRDKGKILIIAFSSNRGLCGSFNANVIREVNNFINNLTDEEKENTEIITIGKKIYDGLKKNNYQIVGRYDELIDKLDYDAIKNLTKLWVQDFIDNKYQKIIFIHNKFKNAAQQFVNIYQFLPLTFKNEVSNNSLYILEPEKEDFIKILLPKYLNTVAYQTFLDSSVSEHGARMTAMSKATENANELLKDLKLEYNKARQDAITKELIEIASGVEALKDQ